MTSKTMARRRDIDVGDTVELLPEGGGAYSHAFAGKGYNVRYHIKRKAQRWNDKFSALPTTERLAIMQSLCHVRE